MPAVSLAQVGRRLEKTSETILVEGGEDQSNPMLELILPDYRVCG